MAENAEVLAAIASLGAKVDKDTAAIRGDVAALRRSHENLSNQVAKHDADITRAKDRAATAHATASNADWSREAGEAVMKVAVAQQNKRLENIEAKLATVAVETTAQTSTLAAVAVETTAQTATLTKVRHTPRSTAFASVAALVLYEFVKLLLQTHWH